MFPLCLAGDSISAFPVPRILLVWLLKLYFLPGYWPVRVLLNQSLQYMKGLFHFLQNLKMGELHVDREIERYREEEMQSGDLAE